MELTSAEHRSGTDRVAEVVERPEVPRLPLHRERPGDEPLLEEAHVRSAVELVRDGPWEIGTCATPVSRRRRAEMPQQSAMDSAHMALDSDCFS